MHQYSNMLRGFNSAKILLNLILKQYVMPHITDMVSTKIHLDWMKPVHGIIGYRRLEAKPNNMI